ncbi:MAG: hypothetical protein V4584_06530 [Verrucomicrobiota bacterium]
MKSQARLTEAKATLEALPVERAAVDADVEKLTASEAAQTKANATLKEAGEVKSAKLAANKEKLDEFRQKSEKAGDLEQLVSKLKATSAELEELGQSIAGAEAKLANLTAQNSSAESQVNGAKTKFDNFSGGQSLASLQTRIRSIYPNWGFVTLASGNNAGVVANSTLHVVRGGETIAKLLVTAVESGTASASIVPDSMGNDVTLRVGDRVEPGQKPVKTPPVAPASN